MDTDWNDLVKAERAANGKSFDQWPERAQDRLIGDVLKPPTPCEGLILFMEQKMFYAHIEKSAQIGKRCGFNEGWAQASVRWAGEKAKMENTIRRIWWALAITVIAGGMMALAWMVNR